MAVSIISQPTTPNVSGTKLLFEVTSSNISHPQYSYVLDVYQSGSNERISRMTQVPNRQGAAVFDPSSVIQGQLYTEDIINITGSVQATNQFKTFEFKVGEAYGTSTSSSVIYYPDQASGSVGIFNGTVNPIIGANFPSQSYMPEVFPFTQQAIRDAILTDAPYIYTEDTFDNYLPIGSQDRHTYSILKQAGYSLSSFGFPREVTISGKRIQDLQTLNLAFAGQLQPVVPNPDEGIVHIPAGPQNLMSASISYFTASFSQGLTVQEFFASEDWYYYTIGVTYTIGSGSSGMFQAYINESLVNYYNFTPASLSTNLGIRPVYLPVGQDKLRFAFANQYGAIDYFNCYAPLRRSSTVDKNIVSLPNVDYSGTTSTYSYERRGAKDYHRDINDQYVITTPLLNQETANWIEQMLESPEVWIVEGSSLIPIVITNSSYISNTNENRQKVFTYDIEFIPANGREIDSTTFSAVPAPPTPQPGQCVFNIIITDKFNCE